MKEETDQPMAKGSLALGGQLLGERRDVWWLGIDRKWWVLVTVGIGTLMGSLDGSITNVVMPVIMKDFGIGLATVEWVSMIYLLVVSGLLLTFGRLGDMAGHVRVFILGVVLFTIGSLLCALSPAPLVLIAMRGLQAVGSAMVMSNSPAILTRTFPGRQRGQALGMQGTMTYLGLMIGPAFGGYLTERFSWRMAFLVNLPIGLLTIALALAVIAEREPASKHESFDLAGAVTFLGGLSALLLALSHGQDWGWTSGLVLALLASAVILLGLFVQIERRVAHPMLDLSMFGTRIFSAGAASALMNYLSTSAVLFLVPFFLIQYRGLDPSQAGILLSTQAVMMVIFAPLSGTLSDRIGSRVLSSGGMIIVTLAVLSMATVDSATDSPGIAARLMLAGLGTALFVSPNSSAVMGSAPRQRQGVASAVLGGARNVGMVMGVASGGAILSALLAAHGASIGQNPGFLPAFRETFLLLSIVGVIGTVTSLARGKPAA